MPFIDKEGLLVARIDHYFLHSAGSERVTARTVHFDTAHASRACVRTTHHAPESLRMSSVVAALWFIV